MINQNSLSQQAIKEDLISYIKSLPEDNRWKDLYESSVGTIFIDLLSGFGAFLAHKIYFTRREVFLSSAQIRSSNLAIASTLGYSAFRGINPHISLLVIPSVTTLVAKYGTIGTYNNFSLLAADDYAFVQGQQISVEAIIGNFMTDIINITTSDQIVMRSFKENISSDYRIKLNDTVVPVSEDYSKMLYDNYFVITNYLNSIDIMYLNVGRYKYAPGDVLTIEYVEYSPQGDVNFQNIEFLYGSVVQSVLLKRQLPPESIPSIKINAPLYHETQKIVRGREDYVKLVRMLIHDCVDSNGIDVSPAIVRVSYVRGSLTLLTEQEKTDLLNSLDKYRPFGIPLPEIVDPIRVSVNFDIAVYLLDPNVSFFQISSDITKIFSDYEKKLGIDINLYSIEHAIERLPYIKVVRITSHGKLNLDWSEYAIVSFNLRFFSENS